MPPSQEDVVLALCDCLDVLLDPKKVARRGLEDDALQNQEEDDHAHRDREVDAHQNHPDDAYQTLLKSWSHPRMALACPALVGLERGWRPTWWRMSCLRCGE